MNLEGAPILGALPNIRPLDPKDFRTHRKGPRSWTPGWNSRYGAAHIPGAQSIWLDGLASFAGWFLRTTTSPFSWWERATIMKKPLAFLSVWASTTSPDSWPEACSTGTCRAESRHPSEPHGARNMPTAGFGEPIWILDVRSEGELEKDGQIDGAQHIHITEIAARNG